MTESLLENHVKYYPNLVPGYGIQKRHDPLVKKVEKERKVRDYSASQRFDVVLLKDRKHLSNTMRYTKNNTEGTTLTLLATDIEGLVRKVVVL